ncbi:MAG TPA: YccF domain-containing protein [Caldilinea sp.]|nr:YccF domain-containing protein [Caldilinea sp.]
MSNQTNVTNVYVNSAPPVVVRSQPGCLVQLLYFVFIGWWLGGAAITLAYFLFLTILGIPLGVMILNKIPYLLALRQTEPTISYYGAKTTQHNMLIRAIWFFVVGIWLTAIWLFIAYGLACIIIGMPIAFWMFDKTPAILTLHRS